MPTMTEHAFDTDTRVAPVAPQRFATMLSDRWNALGGTPNGGYTLAVCLQALRHELPFPDPIVASASYLRRGAAGPAEVHTEVVRDGRRVATGEARLIQDGRELVRVVASFGDLDRAEGRTDVRSRAPELPPAEQVPDVLAGAPGPPGVSIVDRYEYRFPEPAGWMSGTPTGEPDNEFWLRFRDGREPDTLTLAAMVDAGAPAVQELGVAGSATIELTVHVRARPAPGWLACRAYTRNVIRGYHEEDFEIWDSQGALVAQSRQFALLAE